jgi:hypothetical protein
MEQLLFEFEHFRLNNINRSIAENKIEGLILCLMTVDHTTIKASPTLFIKFKSRKNNFLLFNEGGLFSFFS